MVNPCHVHKTIPGGGVMKQRLTKILATLMGLAVLSGGMALADPIDDVQNALLSVDHVTATGISDKQIIIGWTDRSIRANEFRIEVSLDETGPYTSRPEWTFIGTGVCGQPITVVDQNTNRPAQERLCRTTIQLSTASDTRPYFVRVVPLLTTRVSDNLTTGQILLAGKPSPADPALLGAAAPTNLKCNGGGALACVNVQSVTLTWKDNSDEWQFWVFRGVGVVNPIFDPHPVVELPANTTSYSEYLAEFGRKFSYRVVAVRRMVIPRIDPLNPTTEEKSFSNSTNPDTATVETPSTPAPTDPSFLSASLATDSTLTLTWIDQAPTGFDYRDEDGFFIEQTQRPAVGQPDFDEDGSSQHTRPALFGEGTVSWTTSLPADTSRCYRVRAYRKTTTYTAPSYSGYTNVVCPGTRPAAPTNLVANALRNDEVRLTWVDRSEAEDGFIVQRCPGVCTASSGGWSDISTTVPMNATTYTDTTTASLTVYSYRVFAQNLAGRSASSNIATVTTPPARLSRPLNLSATTTGPHSIDLVWTDTTSDESSFELEYRAPGGTFSPLTSLNPNTIYFQDTDLATNETRCYRVRAFKAPNESSDPSNESCATTTGPVGPKTGSGGDGFPTGIEALPDTDIAQRKGNTRVFVRWLDNAVNETGFKVEMLAFPNVDCATPGISPVGRTFTLAGTAPAHSGTGISVFAVEGLQPYSSYLFRVKAFNRDGESAYGVASPPFDASHTTITRCVQTYGPKKPVFTEPNENGKMLATSCSFTLRAPQVAGAVGGVRVYVISTIPGSSIAHTDTLWVGSVPGAQHDPPRNQYIASYTRSGDDWTIKYRFRRGPSYRLLAASFESAAPQYSSAQADVRDVTVVADCPTDELP
jgi:hypothetical protein